MAQFFGKAGYRDDANRADISLTLANTRLEDNQTLPLSWLGDYRQAYSWPDFRTNKLAFASASASHRFSPDLLLEANACHRSLRTYVFNSNVNDDFDTTEDVAPGNEPTGNAINDVKQSRSGVSLQLTSTTAVAGHASHLSGGARLALGAGWEAFANVDNLFDRRSSNLCRSNCTG